MVRREEERIVHGSPSQGILGGREGKKSGEIGLKGD